MIKRHMMLQFSLGFLLMLSCGSESSFTEMMPELEPTSGDVTLYITSGYRIQEFKKTYLNFSANDNLSPNTLFLDPQQTYQTMDGFGAAITGSSAYNLLKMSAADRAKFLKETFSTTEGMGQSYVRIAIGCSDFSLSEYTLNDKPGIENFALQKEELEYVIPVMKEILAINPDIKVMGSPWTAPLWMKVNNLQERAPYTSWTGGHLNPAHYQDYGTYFVKWIQAMEAQGIRIHSITPQNEPLNHLNSASMVMKWEEQRDFIKQALGPKLRGAGLQTKIYAYDHNYNYDNMADQQSYPVRIYEDAEASQYIAGAAYHNYGGDRSELLDIHAKAPDKELIFSETSIGTWNNGNVLSTQLIADMREVGLGTINNWSRGVIVWNLMLDADRGPTREGGCLTCYGAVDIDSDYRTIKKNSHYFVVGHLSAVVKSGAVRIGSKGKTPDGIIHSAFRNPDNSFAIVLANSNSVDTSVTFSDGDKHFTHIVPANSVVSYQWGK
ncbi:MULTISPECIES: glycoside hydrolase family 30 protein [Sphingobacterium]|uniref:Glycoside hydrolase family 30 beta sandwich domain-containing protein n=1 Tax=Sphingobacterium populi TaxID=1812824 RepID=A0ABW5UBL7_9SPHI|nr:glycoside hydrolase family 30 beta sandwich domain-containing protein [Sphingobacterium sp. CFCC 11742]